MWYYSRFLSTSLCRWPVMAHPSSMIVSHSKDKKLPYLYLLIWPLRRPLELGRRRTFIPGFIWSPPRLADYNLSHPLGGVDRDFPFNEDETRKHFSYLSGTSRKMCSICVSFELYSLSVESECICSISVSLS